MKFVKMQAQGNDFIITEKNDNLPYRNLAKKLCDRHFGIGADGLVVLYPAQHCDIGMKIYNSDGSMAEICGSALRCVANYISNGKKLLKIKTDAGIKQAKILKNRIVKVNIGKANFLNNNPIEITNIKGYYVSVGNPHFITFVENLESVDIYVDKIKKDKIFTRGINIEFVKKISENEAKVRVFERGVGETLACGTGAASIQFVGFKTGILKDNLTLHFKGGKLYTDIQDEEIYLSGKTELVYKGEIDL